MLVISKEQVKNLIQKLEDPAKLKESIAEVEKMLEIKSTSLWRSEDMQSCCGTFDKIKVCLTSEVQILEGALKALVDGDIVQASSLLDEYISYLE